MYICAMNGSEIKFFRIDSGARTRTEILAIIAQIDALISSLYSTAIQSVANGGTAEYEIDTGQTKQKVKYTSTESITVAIQGYEKLRTMMENKLQSRIVRLVDEKNFRR
jgi:hypothetical protein